MKKILLKTVIMAVSVLLLVACGSQGKQGEKQKEKFVPDIAIEELDWKINAGTIEGDNCVVFEYTNNSQYDISSLRIDFTEVKNLSQEEKRAFYKDIQTSQGFDEIWMEEYMKSREQLNQPISMYAYCQDVVAVGASSGKVKSYYLGGWTSKNVVYPNIVRPEKATIKYEKDGVTHIIYYNFESELYDIDMETMD